MGLTSLLRARLGHCARDAARYIGHNTGILFRQFFFCRSYIEWISSAVCAERVWEGDAEEGG